MSTLQGHTQSFAGGTSDTFTTPFPHALGTRARDSEGNEYVFVSFGSPATPETLVQISPSYIADAITVGSSGPLGLVVDLSKNTGNTTGAVSPPASYQHSSDNAGWVQIYGRGYVGIGGNAVSPSDAANGPTTVRTSVGIGFIVPTSAPTPLGVPVLVSQPFSIAATAQAQIWGLYVATDATMADVSLLAVTSFPSSHAAYGRVACWLNYPCAVPVSYTS